MLVITGPNGGGKSTVAKLLMGIEPLDAGRIFLDGTDITEYSIAQRANAGIGFAFQQPPRFKGMTVRRFLSLAAGSELPEKECCDLLSGVGLCAREYLNREVDGTLSGGEMKRLEIASVLAKPHKLCILMSLRQGSTCGAFKCWWNALRSFMQGKREPDPDLTPGKDHPDGRPHYSDQGRKDSCCRGTG